MLDLISKVRWIKCPSNHNNIKTCWISYPKNSRVSMQTYKFNDQSYKWRGYCFLVGFPGQVPVNISESTERMLTGEWSGGLAGKYSPLQIQLMKLHNNGGHKTYQIWINARTIPKGNQNMFQLHDINILKHKM